MATPSVRSNKPWAVTIIIVIGMTWGCGGGQGWPGIGGA
jgi:hypothetical protein